MKKNVVIGLKAGLEARPIAHLVQLANQFNSSVYLEMDKRRVNAKSIMGVMSLALVNGAELTLDIEGEDEADAVAAIEAFVTAK